MMKHEQQVIRLRTSSFRNSLRKIVFAHALLAAGICFASGVEKMATTRAIQLPDNSILNNVEIAQDGNVNVFELNGKDAHITTSGKVQGGKSFAFSAWVKPDFAKSRQGGIIVQPGFHNFLGINGAKQPTFSVFLEDPESRIKRTF